MTTKYPMPEGAEAFSIGKYLNRRVTTRAGNVAKILYVERKGNQPVVALVSVHGREEVRLFSADGIFNKNLEPCNKDLILLPEVVTVFYGLCVEAMATTPLFLEEEEPKVWVAKNRDDEGEEWTWLSMEHRVK